MVEAGNFTEALEKTWKLKINPGGEVKCVPLEGVRPGMFGPWEFNRLYSKAEIEELGAESF